MLYSYIALNSENQKLKGVITASDERGAKKKLHNVGLSVLSLQESDESEIVSATSGLTSKKKLPSFSFFVIDPQGKKLSGSIESIDRKNAVRRLAEEYGFEVLSVCESSVPEDLRYRQVQRGIKELIEEVEYEFGITMKHSKEGQKESENNEDIHHEDFEMERKEILQEIEMVSTKTQEILKTHRTTISSQDYTEIEKLLGDLIRLRFSNNFPLIRKLIESLFEKIGETMKKTQKEKRVMRDYDEVVAEEKIYEQIKKPSKNTSKAMLSKLKSFSDSLDIFISAGRKDKKKKKKPNSRQAGIFDEAKDDFTFFRRALKGGLHVFLTGNKILKAKRLQEWRSKLGLWQQKKAVLKQHQDQEQRKKDFEIRKKGRGQSIEIFFFILGELRMFLGSLLGVLFVFAFVASFIIDHNIDFQRVLLERSIHSPSLLLFAIGVFVCFFALVVQHSFFRNSVTKSFGLFIVVVAFSSLYILNL